MQLLLNTRQTGAVKTSQRRIGDAARPPKARRKNRSRIRREYEENTKRIRREYEENTRRIRRHLPSRWLATGLQPACNRPATDLQVVGGGFARPVDLAVLTGSSSELHIRKSGIPGRIPCPLAITRREASLPALQIDRLNPQVLRPFVAAHLAGAATEGRGSPVKSQSRDGRCAAKPWPKQNPS